MRRKKKKEKRKKILLLLRVRVVAFLLLFLLLPPLLSTSPNISGVLLISPLTLPKLYISISFQAFVCFFFLFLPASFFILCLFGVINVVIPGTPQKSKTD